MFAMFYFLGLYIQQVLGYSPAQGRLRVPAVLGRHRRRGAGRLDADRHRSTRAGSPAPARCSRRSACSGFTQLSVDSTYATGLLPWIVVLAFGLGLIFVPLTLTAVAGVAHEDSAVASAVLNTMQQVGGALGLATLSTVFVNNMGDKVAELTAKLPQGGPAPTKEQLAAAQKMIADEAFAYGASRAYLVAAIMIAVGGVVTLVALHVRHQELATDGAAPAHMG